MIQKNRDIVRRAREVKPGRRGKGPVIYWMDRDQRITDNWALLYAQQEALIRDVELLIILFIDKQQLTSPSIQTVFQLQGLAELASSAEALNIRFFILPGSAERELPRICKALDAHLLVCDFSPLRRKRQTLHELGKTLTIPIIEVDAHNIVPAWVVSEKKEYAAYTLRPKVHRLLEDYLTDFPKLENPPQPREELAHPFSNKEITHNLAPYLQMGCGGFKPGQTEAEKRMHHFITNGLDHYEQRRNNPNLAGQSELSSYLHFGQLSPQRLALEVSRSHAHQSGKETFLEELVVRRELSDNFCLYEQGYDTFQGFHPWAQKSLAEHRGDRRDHTYTLSQLENGETHEALWNTCQLDLVCGHKLHGYLRMYWAKKILEWTASPEEALEYAIVLNDRYSIDGTDPNGYTGIAWSIGGIHDRAWPERPVYGKIRYMNERGCRRKFDVDSYIKSVEKKYAEKFSS